MNYLKTALAMGLLAITVLGYSEDKSAQQLESENSQNLLEVVSQGSVTLIFLDALCPMPHFPGCEKFLQSINDYAPEDGSKTYAVFNTLYVDKNMINDFAQQHRIEFPIIIDGNMALHDKFGVYATPYVISLSRGLVVARGKPVAESNNKEN